MTNWKYFLKWICFFKAFYFYILPNLSNLDINPKETMKKYELMIIVNSQLSEDEKKETLEILKKIINKSSWKISNENIWWEKKLAYKINGSENWYYVLYDLEIDWKNIKNISKEINLHKDIWRYMFVARD